MADSSDSRPARWYIPYLLLGPGLLWLFVFFVVPLVRLGEKSLEGNGLTNYSNAFSDYGTVIGRTFKFAALATIACIVLGYPLAYVIAMRAGRYKNALLALVVLPFFTTYLIRAIAWRTLLADGGPIVGFLRGISLMGDNSGLLGTDLAVVGSLTYNFLPFMVLPIYVALEKVDKRLLEAGPDLYASGWRTFRKVTMPLSISGVFAGSLLTFIPAAGDFVNVEFIGSERQTMIGNVIEKNFTKVFFRPQLSALSFVLMALILVAVLVYARLLGTEDLV